ncbi:hypothetical protein PHSY_005913 [Pseudozyma hubeiensis SY62]|uniref:Uncharacterized protein n=1 Tax=Pseudozyma hubeiensis (strain SY62) TaxID=1305764 RepID=R9PJR4_PSEHS|nr:hypothetical protein PHSY_005913 [Pseudozyma hubeiensis SY62]GAC98320.1 hypothetical protein PHSY_005913 [Pseudozyma hubeiensis SY62]
MRGLPGGLMRMEERQTIRTEQAQKQLDLASDAVASFAGCITTLRRQNHALPNCDARRRLPSLLPLHDQLDSGRSHLFVGMVSHTYSTPATSFGDDPIFARTHFLGRVASDGSGLEYQHELLKRRSSRHSDFNRWSAHWLTPVTPVTQYDSDDSSDTDDDVHDRAVQYKSTPAHHARGRSSTLPLPEAPSSYTPVEMARARSMTAPPSSASPSSSESRALRSSRATVGSESKLMPLRPLSIDTAQPLRLAPLNLSTVTSDEPSLQIEVPSPLAAVGPSPKTCSPPVVRIECSESDGSCHGDAGDQDPEAQLAAGIIRLREQRRSSPSKSQRRVGSKRRQSANPPRSTSKAESKTIDDTDSDDAQSRIIRNHGGNFVLRLAEMVLDFGSSALEKLVVPSSQDSLDDDMTRAQHSPIEPRRRSSTTPKELSAEAGELLRRRRERVGSHTSTESSVDAHARAQAALTRSWSVPKLLSLPLFNPSASLRALSASTASTPSTPSARSSHLHPGFAFTSASDEWSKHEELNGFDHVATRLSRQSTDLSARSFEDIEIRPEADAVSPLWRQ